jgi:hypothetical protein
MTPIAPLITHFLREHMPLERGCSPHTCETYAHIVTHNASDRAGHTPLKLIQYAP